MAVPNIFGSATSAIPLSQLDQNFATAITLGNTAVYLGNTTTSLGNVTLTNVLISSTNGDATVNGLTVGRGNASVSTNTAVGASALAANTTGAENTAVGQGAAGATTTGNYNAAMGRNTFALNTTGSSNAAFGQAALYTNSTGSNNTGIGFQALALNTTASNSTAVGYQAGYSGTTGIGNTYFGKGAGYTNTTAAYNVFLGFEAGYNYNTTGNTFNTFVGVQSGYAVTTGTKNTILGGYSGNQGGLDIRTASKYIVLSDGDGNPRAFVNATGNLILSNSSSFYNTAEAAFQVNQSNGNEYTAHFVNSATSDPYGLFTRFTGSDPNNTTNFVFAAYAGTSATYIYRIWSNGTVSARSDSRFKKNIETARDGYADDLSKLRIVKYNWYNHEDNEPKELGWIAQEVEEVFPGLVQTDVADDGTECKSVKLSVFTPMLIKAVQELNAQVKELKAEIDILKGQA